MMDYINRIIHRYKTDGFSYSTKHYLKPCIGFITGNVSKLLNSFTDSLIRLENYLPIRERIVFECENDFADNPRTFYEFIKNDTAYLRYHKAIWLVNNIDYCQKNYKQKNVIFINRNNSSRKNRVIVHYYLSTSKWFIFSHPYWFKNWRDKQIVIHTRHSVFQLKGRGGEFQEKTYDYVLCSSASLEQTYSYTLGAQHNQVLTLGIPRVDLLYKSDDCIKRLIKEYNGERVILSMTTFKQSSYWHDSTYHDSYALNVVNREEEIIKLDRFLKQKNTILVIKIHHLQDLSFLKRVTLGNIVYLTDDDLFYADVQVNSLLTVADVLLTDYSSVFYDYLVLDRPIGFMVADIKEYNRGFLSADPLDEMPGEKLYSFNELLVFLEKTLNGIDEYAFQREEVRKKVYKYLDDNNCKRLFEWMKKQDNKIARL